MSPEMVLPCSICKSVHIDPELSENFGVSVCYDCKDSNPLFGIITKTQARNEYMLTDEELADSSLMPSISRKNPHNPRWADMKLYLRLQVREFAINKYGSEDAIKEALASKNETRTDRKSKQFLKKLKELRSKTKVEKKVIHSDRKAHIHSFEAGVCKTCGMKVVQEEI